MDGAEADNLEKARICAANNADWHQCVFRAHNLASERTASHWISLAAAPPYYSNLVTLSPDVHDAQIAAILDLAAALGRPFSLKDSFSSLSLDQMGFAPLFDAEWIWRGSGAPDANSKEGWERVASESELGLWERCWNDSSPADARVFPPSMLEDTSVAFFGLKEEGRYCAGCIGNRSPDAAGFSNFFAPSADRVRHMKSAVAAVAAFAPDLPIVGYEHGEDLDNALKTGFQSVGKLRIWQKTA